MWHLSCYRQGAKHAPPGVTSHLFVASSTKQKPSEAAREKMEGDADTAATQAGLQPGATTKAVSSFSIDQILGLKDSGKPAISAAATPPCGTALFLPTGAPVPWARGIHITACSRTQLIFAIVA